MNRFKRIVFAVCGVAAMMATRGWTATAASTTAGPIAHVYVQTNQGILLYDEAADGRLTLDSTSPFQTAGQLIGSTGGYVITLGKTLVHLYRVTTNGRIGAQTAQITMAKYADGQYGSARESMLANTGQYVQILFNPTINVSQPCTAYQTYKIGKSTGTLTFVGSAEVDSNIGNVLGPIAQPSNNKFAYAVDVNVPEV